MELKCETETINKIDAHDLNNFVSYVWENRFKKQPVDCCIYLEAPNDSTHYFNVNPVIDKWDEKCIEEFYRCGSIEYYSMGKILNLLCMEGHIEPGRYLIQVSW